MATAPPKHLCANCFKPLNTEKYIKCNICSGKFHYICSDVSDHVFFEAVKKSKNIVFNCNDCLVSSSDLVSAVSVLSNEVRELKEMMRVLLGNVSATTKFTGLSTAIDLAPTSSAACNMPSHSPPPLLNSSSLYSAPPSQSLLNCNTDVDVTILPSLPPTTTSIINAQPNASCVPAIRKAVTHSNTSDTLSRVLVETDRSVIVPAKKLQTDVTQSNMLDVRTQVSTGDALSDVAACGSVQLPNADNVPANNSNWTEVISRKTRKKRIILGENDSLDLEVVVRKRWIHLSSFKPNVSEQQLIDYVSKHADISKNHLTCYKLVKKGVNVAELNSVNFKLGISADFYDVLFTPSLWPANVKIRPFQNFPAGQKITQMS